MNKRADLINNILTTIIAVVGLVIIIFAAVQLYSVYVNQEERNAQALIDSIEGKVNILGDEQKANIAFSGFQQKKTRWIMTSYPTQVTRPDKCYFKNCICICPQTDAPEGEGFMEAQVADCQAGGFCRLFDRAIYLEDFLVPENLFELEINKQAPPLQIVIHLTR